ncbi:LysR family transcriptional regulator [Luteolibacter yonseiensis]|uniref:LysR family transcriptional regulator n=1 Tax=Luteolibacter yonseiensis TaxID=1144680 RepID=A0A934V9V9_9BACT|nr:LysR family transcriptional regulator [Luteolibacter yonseiensis]MBK1814206.1 LysR family transcriptional regulator [Luteolibacter yonseiensis]
MNETTRKNLPDFQGLPNITFRQLEVFSVVCREASYANAALELRSTRANIKRVCEDFQKAVGRPLFEECADRRLQPTAFAQDLLTQVSPLARGLRRLGESVRNQHAGGRILRFAAAGEFFKGGLFTDFLARVRITDAFRPCFLRIETKRFRTALLNAECDVYFGVGISPSDRLDLINLGPVAWKIRCEGDPPARPADLPAGKWWIADAGETEATAALIEAFHAAGAEGGRIHTTDSGTSPAQDDIVFSHDTAAMAGSPAGDAWPRFHFFAVLRKHHPYSELMPRLGGAAIH